MEYLTNRPESTFFSHFIPLFLLFFMLLRSFGLHAKLRDNQDYPKEIQLFVYADKTPFNEKLWWIGRSTQNQRLICSQRTGVFSEFYEQSPVVCTVGQLLTDTEKAVLERVNKLAECITDGQVILCQNPDGTVVKHDVKKNMHNNQKRPSGQKYAH